MFTYPIMGQGAAAAGDPFYSDVTLLLNFNGSDGSTAFVDSSQYESGISTGTATVELDTANYKYGGSSCLFDGGYLVLTPYVESYWDWFLEDYTLEAWVYATNWTTWGNGGGVPRFIGRMASNGATNYWSFGPRSDGKLGFFYFNGGGVSVSGSSSIPTDQWNHIAMTFDHSESQIDLWLNGSNEGSFALFGVPLSAFMPLTIGTYDAETSGVLGWADDIRITKGVARYTENFTPPLSEMSSF